ncbi:MAG: class I SAM-dependent methyltransferase [Caulobacteraceae bacterium]
MTGAMETDLLDGYRGGATEQLVRAVLDVWPQHEKFLRSSLAGRPRALRNTTEIISSLLIRVAEDRALPLRRYAADYRYLCEELVLPEQFFFRREKKYRLSTYNEAAKEIYDNRNVMSRYMNGLFISDALWLNHANAMNDFVNAYLPGVTPNLNYLEIGPGHGMLLHLAIRFGKYSRMSAWDVSPTSIEHTSHVLGLLNETDRVDLQLHDIYEPGLTETYKEQFHTIVLSEVLEHLERPKEAIAIIRELLAPLGSVWINVPVNGPAPDHLFLLRSPEAAAELVASAGLEVARTAAFPVAGASLERARRKELPISCVVVGSKAPAPDRRMT